MTANKKSRALVRKLRYEGVMSETGTLTRHEARPSFASGCAIWNLLNDHR